MRMFAITVAGERMPHEPSGGRTPEEYQHFLVHTEGMRFVRVKEWIKRGARGFVPREREATEA